MQDLKIGQLVYLNRHVLKGCSAGDGCDCDGDVDECIGNQSD